MARAPRRGALPPDRRSRECAARAWRSTHDLDARFLQDAAHLAGELVVEPGELGGVLVAVLELVVLEEFAPRRTARELAEDVFPVRDVFRRNSRRRDDATHLRH